MSDLTINNDEFKKTLYNGVKIYGLTNVISLVAEMATQLEKDIEIRNDIELQNALHYALCDINFLSKKKRPKNFWKWIKNNSSPTHFGVLEKRVNIKNCAPSVKELAKRLKGETDE